MQFQISLQANTLKDVRLLSHKLWGSYALYQDKIIYWEEDNHDLHKPEIKCETTNVQTKKEKTHQRLFRRSRLGRGYFIHRFHILQTSWEKSFKAFLRKY